MCLVPRYVSCVRDCGNAFASRGFDISTNYSAVRARTLNSREVNLELFRHLLGQWTRFNALLGCDEAQWS